MIVAETDLSVAAKTLEVMEEIVAELLTLEATERIVAELLEAVRGAKVPVVLIPEITPFEAIELFNEEIEADSVDFTELLAAAATKEDCNKAICEESAATCDDIETIAGEIDEVEVILELIPEEIDSVGVINTIGINVMLELVYISSADVNGEDIVPV